MLMLEAQFELLIVDEVHWVDDAERGGMVSKLLQHPNLIVMSASIEPFEQFELIQLEAKTKTYFHENETYLPKAGDVVLEFCNSVRDCLAHTSRVTVPKKFRAVYERPYVLNAYHGNMTPTERLLVQAMFIRGDFHYLYATDAAAQGINLPANVVIIPAVNYKGETHDDKVLRQMAGRCARYGQHDAGHVYLKKKPAALREKIDVLPEYKEKTLGDLCRGRVPACFVGADLTTEVRGAKLGASIDLAMHPFNVFTYADFARYQYEFAFLNRVKGQIRPKYREYIEANRQLFFESFSPLPIIKKLTQ
jgi:superfamily II DNA/RNA helicase